MLPQHVIPILEKLCAFKAWLWLLYGIFLTHLDEITILNIITIKNFLVIEILESIEFSGIKTLHSFGLLSWGLAFNN